MSWDYWWLSSLRMLIQETGWDSSLAQPDRFHWGKGTFRHGGRCEIVTFRRFLNHDWFFPPHGTSITLVVKEAGEGLKTRIWGGRSCYKRNITVTRYLPDFELSETDEKPQL